MSTSKPDDRTKYQVIVEAAKDSHDAKMALDAMNTATADRAVVAIVAYCLNRLGWPVLIHTATNFTIHPSPMGSVHPAAFSGTVDVLLDSLGRYQFPVEYSSIKGGGSFKFGATAILIKDRNDLRKAADVVYEVMKSQFDS